MTRQAITGVPELEAALKGLSDRTADKVSRSAISAGLTLMRREIRKAAPKGPTGNLKKSIGKKFLKGKRGRAILAKAGVNVGKRKKGDDGGPLAPHAHLVALGTEQRTRKRLGGKFAYIRRPTKAQLSTGVMPSNDFVSVGAMKAKAKLVPVMFKAAERALKREVAKQKKKG